MAFPQRDIDDEYGHDVDDEDIIKQLKSEKVYNRFKFDIGILLRGEKENIINTFKLVVRSAQPKERKSIAKLLNANKGKFRVDVYGRPDIYDFENAPDYQIDEILETNAYNEPIKNIEQFLRCYDRLPVAQTLEELKYSPSFISSSSDAQKEEILAKQTPYADFIRDRSRAFNVPPRPRPRPRELELPAHMLSEDGGGRRRRRKTKKSKRRSRKTRRRHK
jgi:hypothetical protein